MGAGIVLAALLGACASDDDTRAEPDGSWTLNENNASADAAGDVGQVQDPDGASATDTAPADAALEDAILEDAALDDAATVDIGPPDADSPDCLFGQLVVEGHCEDVEYVAINASAHRFPTEDAATTALTVCPSRPEAGTNTVDSRFVMRDVHHDGECTVWYPGEEGEPRHFDFRHRPWNGDLGRVAILGAQPTPFRLHRNVHSETALCYEPEVGFEAGIDIASETRLRVEAEGGDDFEAFQLEFDVVPEIVGELPQVIPGEAARFTWHSSSGPTAFGLSISAWAGAYAWVSIGCWVEDGVGEFTIPASVTEFLPPEHPHRSASMSRTAHDIVRHPTQDALIVFTSQSVLQLY